MHYGFQRLALLNSAGYQRAEMPLDDSVSLVAPNNMGKTSLINALQFLLIIDRRRMDFGAHDFDKSRRFYFPDNSAYILLEASLPESGTVVLGCVGKGVSYEYEYFAYKGQLSIDDYRTENETLVTQPNLIRHMIEHGHKVFTYSSSEFADIVYGGRKKRTAHEPNFTLFRLEHVSDAPAFQRVLTRTLKLDKLKSADVKEYLLQIFKRELPDATIDFKEEWEKAFAEVNAERLQYQATVGLKSRIVKLETYFDERLALRGKILVWRPVIDKALQEWQQFYSQSRTDLQAQREHFKAESERQTKLDRELTLKNEDLKRQLSTLDATNTQQEKLTQHFALVNGRKQLEDALDSAQQKRDEQTALVVQGTSRSPAAIQRESDETERKLKRLERQQQTVTDNLWRQLKTNLPDGLPDQLNRVLNSETLSLGPDQFKLAPAELKSFLQQQTTNIFSLPGLSLTLDSLNLQHHEMTAAELAEQIHDLKTQLGSLLKQLEVAKASDHARKRKEELENKVRQIEEELKGYDTLTQLKAGAKEREIERKKFGAEREAIELQLSQFETKAAELRKQREDIEGRIKQLEQQHREIDRQRNQRQDQADIFNWLADLPHKEWVNKRHDNTAFPMSELAERLGKYQRECGRLLELDQLLTSGLSELHNAGLTKYQFIDTPEEELKRIIMFSHHLPREAEALEKKARSAVVNVTASLRELRSGLDAFTRRMRDFNRLINYQRLSDLTTFRITPQEESSLVAAIDLLIKTAAEVEAGQSYNLFDQHSVLDDTEINRAKQILIKEGDARQGLRVADLFRLNFVVAKRAGQEESFEDLDSAASNGTVLMAKLVTGLAMLHLMQHKDHHVRAICYLDEALALDANNQKSLIAASKKFGFALIFASPAPLVTVRYCVPIHHQDGYNHISRQGWQILEPLETNHHGTQKPSL